VADIVAGFDSLDGYLRGNPYFGAAIGRYANRIAGGTFSLGGRIFPLAKNNGENSLHGGLAGFDKRVWQARQTQNQLVLQYTSEDGEEGYPGRLGIVVTYSVNANELRIDYVATTDRTTVLNLTNHSYFNLAGPPDRDVLDHELTIAADTFTPTGPGLIPTGELRRVDGTPFDFRTPHRIGERISANDEQLQFGGGYDHNYVLSSGPRRRPVFAARVREPQSGRQMEVMTTEPGLQFYTGNSLDGTLIGHEGAVYKRRYALCLETQHFPDSPNHKSFPSTELKPGQTFRSTTIYRFSAQ
jgi:aldose 1-epimerase